MSEGATPRSAPTGALAWRLLVVLPLLAVLFGCASTRRAQEVALCREATLALQPKDASLEFVAATDTLPAVPESVVVSYRVPGLPPAHPAPLPDRQGSHAPSLGSDWTICRFEVRSALASPLLVELTTSRDGLIGQAVLFYLRTYALGQPTGLPYSFAPRSPLPLIVQQTVNGMREGALIALLAMGLTLILAHTGRLHLTLGDIGTAAALTTLLLTTFLTGAGALPLWLTLILTIAVGVSSGALLALTAGSGAFGRLWRTAGITPLIASVGISVALRESALLVLGKGPAWLSALLPQPLRASLAGGITLPSAASLNLLVAILTCLALGGLMRFARFGSAVRAIADDLSIAAFDGVRTQRVSALVFTLCGACAGLAGALTLLSYGTMDSEGGLILSLKAMAAAVLGGIGSLSGALLVGLLIGVMASLWSAYLDPAYRDVAVLAVLALLLVLRPLGGAPGAPR
ncbi:branched-chain amino acid ABC transporter permease [Arboricoccus pini]|nr:branched-chain amino acid ABC transporter permease [Arboricoccus pini]